MQPDAEQDASHMFRQTLGRTLGQMLSDPKQTLDMSSNPMQVTPYAGQTLCRSNPTQVKPYAGQTLCRAGQTLCRSTP